MLAARFFVLLVGCTAVTDDAAGVLADIGDVLGGHIVNPIPTHPSVAVGSAIMRSMSRLPPPASPLIAAKLDPRLHGTCDRDYSLDCPQQFVSVGSVFGGTTLYCAANNSYDGPCGGDVFNFDSYSIAARARWSSMCLADWPCKECDRDFQSPCPREWAVAPGARACTPPQQYIGPCVGMVDFEFYNKAMLSEWSSKCGAYWGCL